MLQYWITFAEIDLSGNFILLHSVICFFTALCWKVYTPRTACSSPRQRFHIVFCHCAMIKRFCGCCRGCWKWKVGIYASCCDSMVYIPNLASSCYLTYRYIMTSVYTHQATIDYFSSHNFFGEHDKTHLFRLCLGLDKSSVFFFQQGMLPALTFEVCCCFLLYLIYFFSHILVLIILWYFNLKLFYFVLIKGIIQL